MTLKDTIACPSAQDAAGAWIDYQSTIFGTYQALADNYVNGKKCKVLQSTSVHAGDEQLITLQDGEVKVLHVTELPADLGFQKNEAYVAKNWFQ
ncbi:hypothetical protein PQR67_27720 [Paraburkholderia fungorum]|uniref:hypothetical protein n=1 Tax=Paraburkholderia fungorum TaxID=134537 RepID=UPI0038B7D662